MSHSILEDTSKVGSEKEVAGHRFYTDHFCVRVEPSLNTINTVSTNEAAKSTDYRESGEDRRRPVRLYSQERKKLRTGSNHKGNEPDETLSDHFTQDGVLP
jgi:hypothetical protein